MKGWLTQRGERRASYLVPRHDRGPFFKDWSEEMRRVRFDGTSSKYWRKWRKFAVAGPVHDSAIGPRRRTEDDMRASAQRQTG